MIDPDPKVRPSAIDLIQHRLVAPFGKKSKARLYTQLKTQKLRNEILLKRLETAKTNYKWGPPASVIQQLTGNVSEAEARRIVSEEISRLIGKK
jgi:wee1-like protein kinase